MCATAGATAPRRSRLPTSCICARDWSSRRRFRSNEMAAPIVDPMEGAIEMTGTDTRDDTEAKKESGGVEGGMSSGSAGGPSQADQDQAKANESDSGGGAAKPSTYSKVDLGQGSH